MEPSKTATEYNNTEEPQTIHEPSTEITKINDAIETPKNSHECTEEDPQKPTNECRSQTIAIQAKLEKLNGSKNAQKKSYDEVFTKLKAKISEIELTALKLKIISNETTQKNLLIQSLQHDNIVLNEQLKRLKSEARDELHQLKKELDDNKTLMENYLQLKKDFEALERNNKAKTALLQESVQNKEKLHDLHACLEKSIKQYESENASLKTQIDSLQRQLLDQKKSFEELKTEVESLKSRRQCEEALDKVESSKLTQMIKTIQSQLVNQNDSFDVLVKEKDKLKAENERMQVENAQLRAAVCQNAGAVTTEDSEQGPGGTEKKSSGDGVIKFVKLEQPAKWK